MPVPNGSHSSATPSRVIAICCLASLIVVATACGGDGESSVDTSAASTAVDDFDIGAVRAELDDISFESEPIDAGPFMGSGGSDDESADAVSTEELQVEGSQSVPPIDGDPVQPPEQDVVPHVEPVQHVPPTEWRAFCTVIDELNERPLPSDESEALRVVDRWFDILRPTVPNAIAGDIAVFDGVIDRAVEAGDIDLVDDFAPEVEQAGERIEDAMDVNCYGRE